MSRENGFKHGDRVRIDFRKPIKSRVLREVNGTVDGVVVSSSWTASTGHILSIACDSPLNMKPSDAETEQAKNVYVHYPSQRVLCVNEDTELNISIIVNTSENLDFFKFDPDAMVCCSFPNCHRVCMKKDMMKICTTHLLCNSHLIPWDWTKHSPKFSVASTFHDIIVEQIQDKNIKFYSKIIALLKVNEWDSAISETDRINIINSCKNMTSFICPCCKAGHNTSPPCDLKCFHSQIYPKQSNSQLSSLLSNVLKFTSIRSPPKNFSKNIDIIDSDLMSMVYQDDINSTGNNSDPGMQMRHIPIPAQKRIISNADKLRQRLSVKFNPLVSPLDSNGQTKKISSIMELEDNKTDVEVVNNVLEDNNLCPSTEQMTHDLNIQVSTWSSPAMQEVTVEEAAPWHPMVDIHRSEDQDSISSRLSSPMSPTLQAPINDRETAIFHPFYAPMSPDNHPVYSSDDHNYSISSFIDSGDSHSPNSPIALLIDDDSPAVVPIKSINEISIKESNPQQSEELLNVSKSKEYIQTCTEMISTNEKGMNKVVEETNTTEGKVKEVDTFLWLKEAGIVTRNRQIFEMKVGEDFGTI